MKKNKTTVQLLPLDYLLKIGRIEVIKVSPTYSKMLAVMKDESKTNIPSNMQEHWNSNMNCSLDITYKYMDGCMTIRFKGGETWTVRDNWVKP